MNKFERNVKEYWHDTPAVVIVKEIKRRAELPSWENCPKDHIYVGISRIKSGDKITVVKHKIEILSKLKCAAEDLPPQDYRSIGVVPFHAEMICKQCGEFSTRMNTGCICNDCTQKNKGDK